MVNSKRLLLIIGWVNVVVALLLFQAFCGLMAICMGIVLKKDYQAPCKNDQEPRFLVIL